MDSRHNEFELTTYASSTPDGYTPEAPVSDAAFMSSSNPSEGESVEMTTFTPMPPEQPNLREIPLGGSTFFAFPRHPGTPLTTRVAESVGKVSETVVKTAGQAASLVTACVNPKS